MGRHRRKAAEAAHAHAEEQHACYQGSCDAKSWAYAEAYSQFLWEYDIDDIYHVLYLAGISTVGGAINWVEETVERDYLG